MAELTLEEARRILADCDTSDPARAIAAVAMVLRFEGIADAKLLPIAGQLESVADSLRGAAGVTVAPATDWLDEAMKLAEDYARAWQHDADGNYVIKDQAPKAKDKLRAHLALGVGVPHHQTKPPADADGSTEGKP